MIKTRLTNVQLVSSNSSDEDFILIEAIVPSTLVLGIIGQLFTEVEISNRKLFNFKLRSAIS